MLNLFKNDLPLAIIILLLVSGCLVWLWGYLKQSETDKKKLYFDSVLKIKSFILDMIFAAEKFYKGETGKFKKAAVINTILNGEFYMNLPLFIQQLITAELLSNMIDEIVNNVFNAAKRKNPAINKRLEE